MSVAPEADGVLSAPAVSQHLAMAPSGAAEWGAGLGGRTARPPTSPCCRVDMNVDREGRKTVQREGGGGRTSALGIVPRPGAPRRVVGRGVGALILAPRGTPWVSGPCCAGAPHLL